jgi:hypothetical protein
MEEQTMVVIGGFSGDIFICGHVVDEDQKPCPATGVGRLNHSAVAVAAA